jgi:hypothetical protein
MYKRWKKIVAILSLSSMIVAQSFSAFASEESISTVSEEMQLDDVDNGGAKDSGDVTDADVTNADTSNDESQNGESDVTEEDNNDVNITPVAVLDEETYNGMPSNLGWAGYSAGTIKFNHNLGGNDGITSYNGQYHIELYKDGALLGIIKEYSMYSGDEYFETSLVGNKYYDKKEHCTKVTSQLIYESGTYQYRLKVIIDNSTSSNFNENEELVTDLSEPYVYTKPTQELAKPTNVKLGSDGILEWDKVDNADFYSIWVYSSDDIHGTREYTTSRDISNFLADSSETYIVVVQAGAVNSNEILASDFSDEVTYVKGGTDSGETGDTNNNVTESTNTVVANTVTNIVSNLNDSSSLDEVTGAVTTLTEKYSGNDKNALQIAMQSNAETQAQIAKLDDLYANTANVTVKEASVATDIDLDASQIKLVGAALNANEDTTVQMNITKPEKKYEVSTNSEYIKDKYDNLIQFDMTLNGVENTGNLAVPITITMPVPSGIDASKLVILHQQSDGKLEYVATKLSDDKKSVTFTITHFSLFVFAEKVSTTSNITNTDSSSDSSSDSPSSSDNSDSNSVAVTTSTTTVKQPIIGGKKGWSAVNDEVNKALANVEAGVTQQAVVTVALNGVDTIPATVISAIAGKQVILSLSVDANTIVNIDGSTLDATDAAAIRITTDKATDGKNSLKVRSQNLNLEKNIVVYSNAGADKAGSNAVLYFVNADQSLVEFRNSIVFENGYTAFITPFVNADYMIEIK